MSRTSVATDNFNRASLGTNWQSLNPGIATPNISASTLLSCAHSNEGAIRWVGAGSFNADQYSSLVLVTFNLSGGGGIQGALARASGDTDGARDWYEYVIDDTTGILTSRLQKVVNGTRTQLASDTATTWAANDRVEIECEGTTIRGMKNGALVISATDSALATGAPGARVYAGYTMDDFDGGNIAASGGATANSPLLLMGCGV